MAFRDKYFGLPGDIPNATSFWGKDAATCNSNPGTATTPGTCNGNGDGVIPWNNSGTAGDTKEMHRFWQQLALAGLIEGDYTGVAGPGGNGVTVTPGTNSPVSKLTNAGWGFGGNNCGVATSGFYNCASEKYGHYFTIGSYTVSNTPLSRVFKPEEAWNIDVKLDDGLPVLGKIMPRYHDLNTLCTTATSNMDTAAEYNLDDSTIRCALYFVRQF